MKIAAYVRITMSQSSLDIAARSVASIRIKGSIAASDTTDHIVSGCRAGESWTVHTEAAAASPYTIHLPVDQFGLVEAMRISTAGRIGDDMDFHGFEDPEHLVPLSPVAQVVDKEAADLGEVKYC